MAERALRERTMCARYPFVTGLPHARLLLDEVREVAEQILLHFGDFPRLTATAVFDALEKFHEEFLSLSLVIQGHPFTVDLTGVLRSMSVVVLKLGAYSKVVEGELQTLYGRIEDLENEKKEREDYRNYGDWAGAFIRTLGLKKWMGGLELEMTKYYPNHWSRPTHKAVKRILDNHAVSETQFESLWAYKKAGNTISHGAQSGFITVANFEASYDLLYPKIEEIATMRPTLKIGLRRGMEVVHALLTTQRQQNLQTQARWNRGRRNRRQHRQMAPS